MEKSFITSGPGNVPERLFLKNNFFLVDMIHHLDLTYVSTK